MIRLHSNSMDAEAGFVQQHMNAFSNQIIAANIDVRVVLISAYPMPVSSELPRPHTSWW